MKILKKAVDNAGSATYIGRVPHEGDIEQPLILGVSERQITGAFHMRKSILATAAVLALVSGSAFAAFDGVVGGSSQGVVSKSVAGATSSGNGGALTTTSGYQSATSGFNGSSSASYRAREGHAAVSGVAATSGAAKSETLTWGHGAAASGTVGQAQAKSGGFGYYDTHRSNPEGSVVGGATSYGKNAAGTASAGNGYAIYGNKTSNVSTFRATSWGNRDGGYRGTPTTDSVATSAEATSVSTKRAGGYDLGNAIGGQYSRNGGTAGAAAEAEAGRIRSSH